MKIRLILILTFLVSNLSFSQNGKILSKKLIDISGIPIWSKISENDSLRPKFKHLETLNFYFITYESDSLKVNGILVEPKKDGVYPAIIFNRGGNRDFAQLKVSTMIMYTSKLASQGYVVIGSNYRKKDEFGGQEINDVLNLTETIKKLKKADSKKIGMFGWSRGGMMTYLALKKTDKIKTAIIGNGVSDLFDIVKQRPKMETKVFAECIPNYWANKEEELKKRSAIYWTDELNKNSSLLILSGTNDKRVTPIQAEEIAKKLSNIQYDYQLNKYKTDHYFTGYKDELDQLVIEWFNERLKK